MLKKPLGELAFHLDEIRALKERVKAKLKSVKDKFPMFENAKETGEFHVDKSIYNALFASSDKRQLVDFMSQVI